MNPIIANIKNRRSIRAFTDQPLGKDQIELVMESGGYAPHGLTLDYLLFTAVMGDALKRVNEYIRQCLLHMPVTEKTHPYIKRLIEKAPDESSNYFYHAPALIIVSTNGNSPSAPVDCAAATENMLLAASSLGLGACWMNQLPGMTRVPQIRELMTSLHIPEEHLIFTTIVLGLADDSKPFPQKQIKAKQHIIG